MNSPFALTRRRSARIALVLFSVTILPMAAYGDWDGTVWIDGLANCESVPSLTSNWKHVPLQTGPTTIRLTASDFGSSFGATNRLVFVLLDGIEAGYEDYWIFTLNGLDDEVVVEATHAYIGFVDFGAGSAGDNHGGSTVVFEGGGGIYATEAADGVVNCVEMDDLGSWLMVEGADQLKLCFSDFESSPGGTNRLAFVVLDGISGSDDHWFFSLNGIGDVQTLSAARAYVGFFDSGPGDNSGGSMIGGDTCTVAIEPTSWGSIKASYRK